MQDTNKDITTDEFNRKWEEWEKINEANKTKRIEDILMPYGDRIVTLKNKGNTIKKIWEFFIQQKIIDCPYNSFYHFYKEYKRRKVENDVEN